MFYNNTDISYGGRRLPWLAMLGGVLLLAASCTIDSYDKGEGDYSLTTAELVEAHVGSDKKVDFVDTDHGQRLTMQPAQTAKWITKADTVYRAVLFYNEVSSGVAETVSMGRVGVLVPRSLSTADTTKADPKAGEMKTDPLYLESAWVSKSRRYLNLQLRLLTGSTGDEEAVHTIGLVSDSLKSTVSHACLRLYHDQGGRPEYYSATTYVSIPLYSMDADTITLEVNTYDKGTLVRTFVR